MNKRTRKEMKHDQEQHYGGLIAHCEMEDTEQEKYLAEWNKRLKERKKRKDERN